MEEVKIEQLFGSEEVKEKLFASAMKGKWNEVVDSHKDHPDSHGAKITRSGDTALHVAVSDGQTKYVLKLVEILKLVKTVGEESSKAHHNYALFILSIKNDKGETPLHLAATLGNVEMCHCMAGIHPQLIDIQNSENETPLFLSVLHGKKEAYMCLNFHSQVKNNKGPNYTLCRKDNGDTILHSAISGDYFSLAFQILHDYPDLVNYVNESGLSPLHILANKPNAFKSGTVLGSIDRIIYPCIFAHELEKETWDHTKYLNDSEEKHNKYPQNYQTCVDFFGLIKTLPKVSSNTQNISNCFTGKQINGSSNDEENQRNNNRSSHEKFYPPNYSTIIQFLKFMCHALLIVLGLGYWRIQKIREKKERHTWAIQIMNKLVESVSMYKYDNTGRNPNLSSREAESSSSKDRDDASVFPNEAPFSDATQELNTSHSTGEKKEIQESKKKDTIILVASNAGVADIVEKIRDTFPVQKETQESKKKDTPILVAAKAGVTEIVEKILDTFPVAIQDLDSDKKNVVLLAVEHRQPDVYNLLLNRTILKESIFRQLDSEGNSALHLAAKFGDQRPWLVPGAALQMQWENKWYRFVKDSMPRHFFIRYNNLGQTPRDIFTSTHKDLVARGSEWLTKTSESCSVVAALIATVAFATSSTVPGGVKQDSGIPTLEKEPAFDAFAISSLIALCFSVTALVFFLSILTSRFQEDDFVMDLPRKLLVGLSSLFISIASMLVSFCAGHFFVLKDKLRYAVFPVYAATCLPVTFFAFAQLPLYFDLTKAIFNKVPQRSSRT